MTRARLALAALLLLTSASPAFANKALKKPVKVVINAVRYGKDALAMRYLALDTMTQDLNRDHWDKLTPAVRKEFARSLGHLLKKITFKKARGIFKHIDAILFSKAKVSGNRAQITTTIVVHRAYKKKELQITWALAKRARRWLIVDTIMAGQSTVKGIRDDEVNPLVKKGGVALLMKKLRAKVVEVGK